MATKITSRGHIEAGSLGKLPTKEGGTVNFGHLTREPVIGDDGVLGYSESYESSPQITVTIAHAKSTDEDALRDFTDETVTYITNSGKTYTLLDSWVGNPLELSIQDGQIEVTFYGTKLIAQ